MPTPPPTLTAAPASPDRADRGTFAARAVALDDWTKNVHIPEIQTAINVTYGNATSAESSAVIAAAIELSTIAASNYKGDWATLAGALNMPASVSSMGTFWALTANLANVATETPGASVYWLPIVMGSIPQVSKSADYTLVVTDAGRHILHPSADTTARTFTIPANSAVEFPVGTVLTFINQNAAGIVTLAITSDVMRWAPSGTTGSRFIAANGVATAVKLSATEWIVNGVGLS